MESQKHLLLISANQLTDPYPVYPLGIAYLVGHLRTACPWITTSVVDMNTSSIEQLIEVLKTTAPDYIGVSLRNIDDTDSILNRSFIRDYETIVRTIRSSSRSPIVLGGAGFSIFPRVLFERLRPDFGIVGEGEQSLCRLLEALAHGLPYDSISGLVYARDGVVVTVAPAGETQSYALEFDDDLAKYYWQHGGMLALQTKRGCPRRCIYCTYPLIEGPGIRTIDPDLIVRTLGAMKAQHGVDYVWFADSVFNIAPAYNRTLARALIDSGLHIRWGAYFSPSGIDRDSLALFKQAGLTHIEFGTESLSDTQLRNYGKHFSVRDVISASAVCNEAGIHQAHFLIIGGYGETDATVAETLAAAREIENAMFFPYFGMRIYPGTRLAEAALREGVISPDDDLLMPRYYISKNANLDTFKERAVATGRKWMFPDANIEGILKAMRKKNWKGPLWEHALY